MGVAVAAVSLAACSASIAAPPSSALSFAPLKQIDAGGLTIGYAEDGPRTAPR